MIKGWQREHLRDLAAARSVLLLVVLLAAIHACVSWRGGVEAVWAWYEALGLSRAGILGGKVWQFVSHAFLHGHEWHLGLNLIALLLVGARLERIGGPGMFARVIGLGVVFGGVAHLLLAGSSPWPLVGISGGIFAGIVFLTGISPESRMWPLPISGKNFGWGVLAASALLASLHPGLALGPWTAWGAQLDAMTGGGLQGTSHACHLGGALAGLAAARWLLRPRVTLEKLQKDRLRREGPAPSGPDC